MLAGPETRTPPTPAGSHPAPPRVRLSEYRRVLPYLRPHRWQLAWIIFLSVLSTGTGLWLPILNKRLVDEGLLARDFHALVRMAVWMAGITAAGFVLNIASSYTYVRVSAAALFAMRLDLYRHLQRVSPRHHARASLGEFVSRLNGDVAEVQRVTADTLLALLSNVVFLVGAVVLMLMLSPMLFVIAVAVLPLTLWLVRKTQHRMAGQIKVMRERSTAIGSFLIESLSALRLTVLNNAQQREQQRFRSLNQGFVDALLSMQLTGFLAGGIPATAVTLSTSAVFLIGGAQVLNHQLTLGALVAFLAYHGRLLAPVQNLMSLYGNLTAGAVSLRRVFEVLAIPVEVQEPLAPKTPETLRGEIVLDHLFFGHGPAPVLKDVCLRLEPGRSYALMGRSGAGKSTLADLLVRFFDPTAGRLTLDGVELRELPLGFLRSRVAVVEQSPIIFHSTIRDNIAYALPEASSSEVEDAARAAALALPLDTACGERGQSLSAGERQRIALARVFLRDPKVVIFDEPTSALDQETTQEILPALERAMAGRTSILITHAPELTAIADEVLVLEDAQIRAASVVRRGSNEAMARRSC